MLASRMTGTMEQEEWIVLIRLKIVVRAENLNVHETVSGGMGPVAEESVMLKFLGSFFRFPVEGISSNDQIQ